MRDNDLRRYTTVLRELLEERSCSLAELDRRLGWAYGSSSRILRGGRELKLRSLLAILAEVGVAPLSFFHRVYAAEGAELTADRALRHLDALAAPSPAISFVPPVSTDELRRLIEDAIEKALKKG